MLFSSHVFLFLFLPIVLTGYFLLNRIFRSGVPAKLFLVAANLLFYGWFNASYVWIILASILVNFGVGRWIYGIRSKFLRRTVLLTGILFNVAMIGYFKYADFFIENVNFIFHSDWPMRHILLPLGISFFTFQQLAYLVNVYRNELQEKYDLLTYFLFVSFFPQLIAGPIVLPGEMMPQFEDPAKKRFSFAEFSPGLWLFAIGLAKKLILADNFAPLADGVFDAAREGLFIDPLSAWTAAAAYTLQIYFDFSGYCDMAMGCARMFNITLPLNFDSPYRSGDIREFWRRWHITLGRFLAQYVYFPLGGSKKGEKRAWLAILVTFFVSGLWHGAGWTFVLWGILHGLALCVHRFYSKQLKWKMPKWSAVPLTFLFVLLAWVLFRADDLISALRIYQGMTDLSPAALKIAFADVSRNNLVMFLCAAGILFLLPNAAGNLRKFKPTAFTLLVTVLLLVGSVFFMSRVSPFIYFNF